jgi:hypothetical protein
MRTVHRSLLNITRLYRKLAGLGGICRSPKSEEKVMNRRTIISLVAACAVGLSAIAASGAMAGATAYTCVESGSVGPSKFSDPDCKVVAPGGNFGHVEIAEHTTLKMVSLTNAVFVSKIFGATVQLEATGLECVGCTFENKLVGGVMEVTGELAFTFTGVQVVGMPGCEVVGAKSEDIGTRPLKFTTTSASGATIEPVTPPTVAEFKIVTKPTKTCTVAGGPYKLEGKIPVTFNGAIMTINVTSASGALKLDGTALGLKAETTLSGGKPESGVHHPIALTNTSP